MFQPGALPESLESPVLVTDPCPLPGRELKAVVGQMPWSSFPGWALSVYMCSCKREKSPCLKTLFS